MVERSLDVGTSATVVARVALMPVEHLHELGAGARGHIPRIRRGAGARRGAELPDNHAKVGSY